VLVVSSRASAKKGFAVARQLRQSSKRVAQQTLSASGKDLIVAAMDAGMSEDAHTLIVVDGSATEEVVIAQRMNGRFRLNKTGTPIHLLVNRLGRKHEEIKRKR
jgi:hypothetical protein